MVKLFVPTVMSALVVVAITSFLFFVYTAYVTLRLHYNAWY